MQRCFVLIKNRIDLWLFFYSQTAAQSLHTKTSGYATWFTAGGAVRIAHYDVIDDVITRKL